jgi:hypothetical protein
MALDWIDNPKKWIEKHPAYLIAKTVDYYCDDYKQRT